MTSFAHQVKNELVRKPLVSRCCAAAELKAFLELGGRFVYNKKTVKINLQTRYASVARRLFLLYKFYYGLSPEIISFRKQHLQKNSTFLVQIFGKKNVFLILRDLGFLPANGDMGNYLFLPHLNNQIGLSASREKCCRRAYLRGAFLAGGSINDPRTGYHLEIVIPCEAYAGAVKEVLASFDLEARYFQRKDDFVLYLKNGEEIGEFFRIIAAPNALLKFENIRIVKSVRNKINRLINCETANLTRTVVASQEQIANITLIEDSIGLSNITPSLAQVARLRLLFPEATLQELGEMVDPPLSKSSINHRLRRINDLARKIKQENNMQ